MKSLNLKIARELNKIARELMAGVDYIYDPEHRKHPGGGYHKTEKGWSKSDEEKDNRETRMTGQQIQLDDKSKSENDNVRKSVARNSLSSRETLDKLSGDRNMSVRKGVALNPNTSAETLNKLSEDESWEVRKGVAENQHTHITTLDKLSKDKNENVATSALKTMQRQRNKHIKGIKKAPDNNDFFKTYID